MGRKKRRKKKSRPVSLFIVEGCTEENYVKRLKQIYRTDAGIYNCRGGNARGVLKKADSLIRKGDNNYTGYVVWFDSDKYFASTDTNLKSKVAARADIYMSRPCIENWLLAHFQDCLHEMQPCTECEAALRAYIPNYQKGDCSVLDKHITAENIEQATQKLAELKQLVMGYFVDSS